MIARFSSPSPSSPSSLRFAFARRRKTRRFRGDNRIHESGNDASPRALVDEEESSSSSSSSSSSEKERRRLKDALVEACRGMYRGALFASNERETKAIFDAKARLEQSFQQHQKSKEGEEFDDFDDALLDGRWKLIFTTALDVTGLLVLSIPPPPVPFFPPPPVVVGDIFQEFKTETKEIVNEIRVSVPFLLEEKDGVILRVNATYKEAKSSNGGLCHP